MCSEHGLFLGLENIMLQKSKRTLRHFSVVIDNSLYGENKILSQSTEV